MPQTNGEDWEQDAGDWEAEEKRPTQRAVSAGGARRSESGTVAGEFSRFLGAMLASPRGRGILLIGTALLCGVCALGSYLVNSLRVQGNIATATPTAIAAANASPAAPGGATPSAGTGGARPGVTINGTPVPAAQPVRVNLGGTPFTVQPLTVDAQQNASYDRNARNTAFWFPGTLVNYMLGVHASAENKKALESYKPGDVIMLDTGAGTLRYQVEGMRTVKATDVNALRNQTTPQLSLILMGEGGNDRSVLVAKYLDEGVPNVLNPMRFPININDMRVRVTGDKLIPGNTVGLAPGKNYYQVNVELTNIVTRPLDTAQFVSELLDGGKTKFALSRQASSAGGASGWPTGVLNPGQTVNAVAGFEVPDSMPGPRLEWRFAPGISTPAVALVSIPYAAPVIAPTSPAPAAPSTDVVVVSANLDTGTNELRIVGTVANKGATPIVINLRDVTLTSGSASPSLTGALPPLKWDLPPGETLAFVLNFQRPPGGAPAIFKILDQAFEIGGL